MNFVTLTAASVENKGLEYIFNAKIYIMYIIGRNFFKFVKKVTCDFGSMGAFRCYIIVIITYVILN